MVVVPAHLSSVSCPSNSPGQTGAPLGVRTRSTSENLSSLAILEIAELLYPGFSRVWKSPEFMQFLLNLQNFFQVYFWEVFAVTFCMRAFAGKSECSPKIGHFTSNY